MLFRCPECHSKNLVPIVYFSGRGLEQYPHPQDEEGLQKLAEKRLQEKLYPDQRYTPLYIQKKREEILQELKTQIPRAAKQLEEMRRELEGKEEIGKLVAKLAPIDSRDRRDLHCRECGRDWILGETCPNGPTWEEAREREGLLGQQLHRSLKDYADELASHTTWGEYGGGITYPETLSASYYAGSLAIALLSRNAGDTVGRRMKGGIRGDGMPTGPEPDYERAREMVEASEALRLEFFRLIEEEALLQHRTNTLFWKTKDRVVRQEEETARRKTVEISVAAMKTCIEATRLIGYMLALGDLSDVASLEYAFRLLSATFRNAASNAMKTAHADPHPLVILRLGELPGTLRDLKEYESGISETVQDSSKEFDGLAGALEAKWVEERRKELEFRRRGPPRP